MPLPAQTLFGRISTRLPPFALAPSGSAQLRSSGTGGLVCGSAEPGRPSGGWKEPPGEAPRYAPIPLAAVFFPNGR